MKNETLRVIAELSELMPGNFYWKNAQGIYLGCNALLVKTLGLTSKDDIVGKTDYELWPAQADELRRNDLSVMETGIPLQKEEIALLADGSRAYFTAIKVPMKDGLGGVIGIIGNSLDITAEKLKLQAELEKKEFERRAHEALAKAAAEEATTRAILVFSGMATHDLRTPLSSANLRATFIKKYEAILVEVYKAALQANLEVPYIQPEVLEDLMRAPDDILRAMQEANMYIDTSLKSIKGASLGEELLKADQLVECQTERLFQRIKSSYPYKEGGQDLLHIDSSFNFKFMGNEIYFNRLIENLIKNAFEQIRSKGRGEIFIYCEPANAFNLIKIKDTAGNVTQDIVKSLFSGIGSSKQGGTGVGLSSAKQVMRAMGGDINCHVVDGDCIEFVLSFPAF